MKKLNNKGFAISTLIYGLAIMGIMIVAILMATMSQTRSNTRSLVKSIEEDLNRFSKTETSFKPINNSSITAQEYIVPTSGWYKIELWGAQGSGNGGKGAYTGGIIELEEGETLYFYVGSKKSSGGGYASEVRVIGGGYDSITSYETRIMVAAGGGTTSTASGGTLYGYNDKMNSYGGYIDIRNNKDFSLIPKTDENNNTNGTLVGYDKNYAVSTATNPSAEVDAPSPLGTNGGGDGYFPSNNSSTGGTSFIAGYAGCYGLMKGKTKVHPKLEYYEHFYEEEDTVATYTYSEEALGEYYFVDGVMMPGVHSGDGYAKIERVKPKIETTTTLTRKNTKLDNIRYIKNCVSSPDISWSKISVTVNGSVIEKNPTPIVTGAMTCGTIDLELVTNVDEIAIFHNDSGIDYKQDTIQVSVDGTVWTNIKKWDTNTSDLSETETVTGYRVSAYQYDATEALPNGNYIIQPVLSENKVLSAASTAETETNPISIEPYNGEQRQKWKIERINDVEPYEYKIIELSRLKALSITQDENILFNTVSAVDKFNEKARNEPQIWRIIPVGNGTYIIETVVSAVSGNTGYLTAQTNANVSENLNKIIISNNNKETARFKFIQIDYSSN